MTNAHDTILSEIFVDIPTADSILHDLCKDFDDPEVSAWSNLHSLSSSDWEKFNCSTGEFETNGDDSDDDEDDAYDDADGDGTRRRNKKKKRKFTDGGIFLQRTLFSGKLNARIGRLCHRVTFIMAIPILILRIAIINYKE